ncbi:MAG: DUF1553 domain-containing protein [Akkermansiaceae bacterium]|nr:DUF1553 domain-containing protein [Akkermansiaceae bacterium]MCP5550757.1 DUF1553 domain-containing protein [Akkermansiaceae bacterium]
MALLGAGAGIPVMAEEKGAPEYVEPAVTREDSEFWSFQPIRELKAPVIEGLATANPIDAFVLAKLREAGVESLAPEADADTLLRRLSFVVTGLPPSEALRSGFLEGRRRDPEAAWREAVDRLLDSPHYGERWAQHWLDVARFAETDGFEHDKVRGEAWRYRDWVVGALNADMPFARFVALQVAGDELEPENADSRLATGFLFAGPDMPDVNLAEERRHNVLNELTATAGAAFLGLTLECAQCHDHRSDPVSQADFYRMRAFFENLALPKKDKSLPHIVSETGPGAGPSHLMIRGDFRRPGPEVAPAFPRVLDDSESPPQFGSFANSTGRRAEFARWLTSEENPLPARVMANRLWQHDFGVPLVGTPSDFGHLGDRPTHPELLDWLASELRRQNGSFKALHRLILTSRAWRQTSARPAAVAEAEWAARLAADPENRLLSRQNRRRLDGEAIRDTMLSVAGRLNPKAGGPGVRPVLPEEVASTLLKDQWPVTPDAAEHDRRSLYLFMRRNLRYPLFEAFDRPAADRACARRHVSTTAPQALMLLNDATVADYAASFAKRLSSAAPDSTDDEIRLAFRLALGREPASEELRGGRDFVAAQSIESFCHAIFNLNEFVFLD